MKKTTKKLNAIRLLAAALLIPVLLTVQGCDAVFGLNDDDDNEPSQNIVEIAIGNPDLETLVAALQAADLVETLQGDGPFTVFAPTDDAFAALPEGTVEGLLKPENQDQLRAVLMYHVVAGAVTAEEVVTLDRAETLQGAEVEISTSGEMVMINDATVTRADVEATNGVIHIIDTVLLPPSE